MRRELVEGRGSSFWGGSEGVTGQGVECALSMEGRSRVCRGDKAPGTVEVCKSGHAMNAG